VKTPLRRFSLKRRYPSAAFCRIGRAEYKSTQAAQSVYSFLLLSSLLCLDYHHIRSPCATALPIQIGHLHIGIISN
jgi:hypothetical protein